MLNILANSKWHFVNYFTLNILHLLTNSIYFLLDGFITLVLININVLLLKSPLYLFKNVWIKSFYKRKEPFTHLIHIWARGCTIFSYISVFFYNIEAAGEELKKNELKSLTKIDTFAYSSFQFCTECLVLENIYCKFIIRNMWYDM